MLFQTCDLKKKQLDHEFENFFFVHTLKVNGVQNIVLDSIDFNCMNKNILQSMFHRRKNVTQVWNDRRVKNLHPFWVNYAF